MGHHLCAWNRAICMLVCGFSKFVCPLHWLFPLGFLLLDGFLGRCFCPGLVATLFLNGFLLLEWNAYLLRFTFFRGLH